MQAEVRALWPLWLQIGKDFGCKAKYLFISVAGEGKMGAKGLVSDVAVNRRSRTRQCVWAQVCWGPRGAGVSGLEGEEGGEAAVSGKLRVPKKLPAYPGVKHNWPSRATKMLPHPSDVFLCHMGFTWMHVWKD